MVDRRGRPFVVADRLPRLPLRQALARVRLPTPLNWSDPGRIYNLADRVNVYLKPFRALDVELPLEYGREESVAHLVADLVRGNPRVATDPLAESGNAGGAR